MGYEVRLNIRIDDDVTHEIYRFQHEKSPIIHDSETSKLYRLKMISGKLNTQEITITDGAIVEVGDPIEH